MKSVDIDLGINITNQFPLTKPSFTNLLNKKTAQHPGVSNVEEFKVWVANKHKR